MEITRTSVYSGKVRTMEIDCTQEQLDRWTAGELIKKVMPHLSEDDREFIISGATPEEWDEVCSEWDKICSEEDGGELDQDDLDGRSF